MQKFYKSVFRLLGYVYIFIYILFVFYLCLLQIIATEKLPGSDPLDILLLLLWWLATLLVFAFGHICLKRREKKEAKASGMHRPVKKPNLDLKAWDKRTPLLKEGRILWCGGFLLFYAVVQRFYLFAALLPYFLFQICRRYVLKDFVVRRFMKRLLSYVQTATVYDNENEYLWKEITHGILMKDDTKRVPVTFSTAIGQPTDVLIFDNETEILPHPKDVIEPRWAEIYLFAAFFIYVLQANKYTAGQLEKEMEKAIMHTHFQISKPIYIYLIGDKDALQAVKEKYDWLPELNIQIVKDYRRVDLQYVIDDYHSRKWVMQSKMPMRKTNCDEEYLLYTKLLEIEETRDNRAIRRMVDYRPDSAWYMLLLQVVKKNWTWQFSCHDERFFLRAFVNRTLEELPVLDKNVFYRNYNKYSSQIYLTIPHQNMDYCFTPKNYYLCGFFHNMFKENARIPSILAGFDYADLLLRFVLYHMAQKRGLGFREDLVDDNIQFMGDKIAELARPEDCIYRGIADPVEINVTLRNALALLAGYFPVSLQGDKLSFKGLCMLLRVIRNQTRGHGSIKEEIAEPLWFALYVLLVILGEMLRVQDFQIELTENGKIMTGYFPEKSLCLMENYSYAKNGFPCILYECSKNGREYINYFQGDIIVPDIIRSEEE